MTTTPVVLIERVQKWPDDPFGLDHATRTAHLAEAVGRSLGLEGDEINMCRVVAMLHDVARTGQWWQRDSGHAARSADMAAHVIADDPAWMAQPDLVARILRIIAQHDLDGQPPTDPVAVALWDADSLEAARLAPMSEKGRDLVRTRYRRIQSPWARQPSIQERHLKSMLEKREPGLPWTPGVPAGLLR